MKVFKEGQLLDSIESFEAKVAEHEEGAAKEEKLSGSMKIGVVVKGIG